MINNATKAGNLLVYVAAPKNIPIGIDKESLTI
jgi:hypothetical protein